MESHLPFESLPVLDGDAVKRLMRVHKKTIRGLARSMNITHSRVRHVRAHGVKGEHYVRDWLEAIAA